MHQKKFDALQNDISADFLIVGGGIAGLAAAYFLQTSGQKNVVLIEQNSIGSGATGHSAGMLVCEPETASWAHLVAHFGAKRARTYWDAQMAALKLVKHIAKEEHIPCDLVPQELLMLADSPLAIRHILKDFSARKSMRSRSKLLSGKELYTEFSTHAYMLAERTAENLSVNPLLFARGFARYLNKQGVAMYENTACISARDHLAITSGGKITYAYLITCQGIHERRSDIQRYLTTIAVTRELSEKELRSIGLADKDMFLDDGRRSFHYGKITEDSRLLIGYGDVKRKKKYAEGYVHAPHMRSIERFLKRIFPSIPLEIAYSWSAEYALSPRELPLVSFKGEKVSINGAGTQLASIAAASYGVSKILGEEHPLDSLFAKDTASKLTKPAVHS